MEAIIVGMETEMITLGKNISDMSKQILIVVNNLSRENMPIERMKMIQKIESLSRAVEKNRAIQFTLSKYVNQYRFSPKEEN